MRRSARVIRGFPEASVACISVFRRSAFLYGRTGQSERHDGRRDNATVMTGQSERRASRMDGLPECSRGEKVRADAREIGSAMLWDTRDQEYEQHGAQPTGRSSRVIRDGLKIVLFIMSIIS